MLETEQKQAPKNPLVRNSKVGKSRQDQKWIWEHSTCDHNTKAPTNHPHTTQTTGPGKGKYLCMEKRAKKIPMTRGGCRRLNAPHETEKKHTGPRGNRLPGKFRKKSFGYSGPKLP